MSDLSHVDTLLARLRAVPTLADRYAGIGSVHTMEDLASVPVMFKDDLQIALAHNPPRASEGATIGRRSRPTTYSSTGGARARCGARTSSSTATSTTPGASA
jgi:hypothetical protein